MTTITYSLSAGETDVRTRLARATDPPSLRYWALPGTTSGQPVVGEVHERTFWWRLRHRGRASFAPWLTGRIEPSSVGTEVVIDFHSPLTTRVWILIAVLVTGLLALWLVLTPDPSFVTALLALLAASAVAAFPYLGTRAFAGEREELRRLFETAFPDAVKQG